MSGGSPDVESDVFERPPDGMAISSDDRRFGHASPAARELLGSFQDAVFARCVGELAHDFNNLLTVILGNAAELAANATDASARRLHEIEAAARSARDLTWQLLSDFRRQPSAARPISLNAELTEIAPVLSRLAGNEAALELALDPTIGPITADPGRIERILLNLVANAREAMPAGGTVTITTRHAPPSGPKRDRRVLLEVSDTGTGIDPETRERIFDPFFTTRKDGEGSGLGLSIVASIVEELRGQITLDSNPGTGTRFQITFPGAPSGSTAAPPTASVTSGGEGAPDRAPARAPAADDATGTILIVDNDEAVRAFVHRTLVRGGHRVLQAATPREALDRLRQAHLEIDLLLCDVVMPEMDGFELADQARRARPSLRVAFISGYAARVPSTIDDDPIDLLPKPFTPDELLDYVHAALAPFSAQPEKAEHGSAEPTTDER